MPVCCIGGVCIPYTAVVPLLVWGLKFVIEKMVQFGLVPIWMQDKFHALVGSTPKKSASSKTASLKRRSSRMKQTDVSNKVTVEENCCQQSCCGQESTVDASETGKVTTIETEEDWNEFAKASFSEGNHEVVLVKMTATWCNPCKQIQPFFAKLVEQNGLKAAILDVDELDEIAAQYKIAALPTFLALSEGRVVERYSGSSEAKLSEFFQHVEEFQQQ